MDSNSPLKRALRGLVAIAGLLCVSGLSVSSLSASTPFVDLELVLAVDASGSVDHEEYRLQLSGIAAAFRDAEVVSASRSGLHGRIAAKMLIWSDNYLPTAATTWYVIDDADSAEIFARHVETFPRSIIDNGTGIGNALLRAADAIEENNLIGTRRVIDVSGDGRENSVSGGGKLITEAREEMRRRGIIVNGLAILAEEPSLASYYHQQLIVGPSAFVMSVGTFQDFAKAMRMKLLREIGQRAPVS